MRAKLHFFCYGKAKKPSNLIGLEGKYSILIGLIKLHPNATTLLLSSSLILYNGNMSASAYMYVSLRTSENGFYSRDKTKIVISLNLLDLLVYWYFIYWYTNATIA